MIWASQVALLVNNPPTNAGDLRDAGSIPGSGRSPGGGNGHPLQYSCLENPMDRGACWATVHRVAKSQTQLKRLSTHTGILYHTLNLKSDSKTYTIWLLLISPSPLQSPFLLFSLLHPLGHLDVLHLCKACPISWLHMAVPSARDLFPPDLHLTPSHLTSICSISPLRAAF